MEQEQSVSQAFWSCWLEHMLLGTERTDCCFPHSECLAVSEGDSNVTVLCVRPFLSAADSEPRASFLQPGWHADISLPRWHQLGRRVREEDGGRICS